MFHVEISYFYGMHQKIVITGGPGTGKSTIIQKLTEKGYHCEPEISRAITLEAREQGVEHLFLSNPLLFSEELLEKRTKQYDNAPKKNTVFFDRGIPDILAYLNYARTVHEFDFNTVLNDRKFQKVFITPPWKLIHTTDNERYENFKETEEIHEQLLLTYQNFGYSPIEVPFGTPEERVRFILQHLD